ncbi:8328_t:CDS:1, partial [Racocetra persica]
IDYKKVLNLAKLHAYYITNACHELNYIRQNLSESDFLKMMNDYIYSLTSGSVIFDEDIQLYDSENDPEDSSKNNNNLSEINSKILGIEDSINLEYMSSNTDYLIFKEIIEYSKKDFNIDALASQGIQMRNTSIDVNKED